MGMHFDVAGVYHQPFVINVGHQLLQQLFPYPRITPADKPSMGVYLVFSGHIRHGAPVRNIQNTALMNRRLSLAYRPPHTPSRPGKWRRGKVNSIRDL